MARKITMFELHFDGASFGPTFGATDEERPDDETDVGAGTADEESADASGRSRVRTALPVVGAVAVLSVLGGLAARRFRAGGYDADSEDAEAPADLPVQ